MSFKYPDTDDATLKNIVINIRKGERVGIIGKTGSGKSTSWTVMGLLTPSEGELYIDNQIINNKNIRSWQSIIAHVPQNIFLADASIAQNIALSLDRETIDISHMENVAQKAEIFDTIMSFENKFQTVVGERGARISGGQAQRIGLARALYRNAEVLIFDEATSALDMQTSEKIMKTIMDLDHNITIIIISHSKKLVDNCSQIIELANGEIQKYTKGEVCIVPDKISELTILFCFYCSSKSRRSYMKACLEFFFQAVNEKCRFWF